MTCRMLRTHIVTHFFMAVCHAADPGGRGALIYFSVRGRAAEQGIIFRIPTPGQGIIFVKIGSTIGSIWGRYGHF